MTTIEPAYRTKDTTKHITEYHIESSPVYKSIIMALLVCLTLFMGFICIELTRIDNGICIILRNMPLIEDVKEG